MINTKLNLKMYQPNEKLKRYIQCYWVIDNEIQENKRLTQKIISDGSNGLVFNLASKVDISVDRDMVEDLSNIFITGSTMKPTYLTMRNKTKLIGIRFNIGGSYPFFLNSLNDYIDKVANFENLNWNKSLEILKSKDDPNEMVQHLDNFLLEIIIKDKINPTNFVLDVIGLMLQNSKMSKDELCKNLNISHRQLERNFKELVGLSVKQILSIIRVHNSRELIRNNDFLTLTEVGYDCNYFDQSHFIREFKKFTDTTPKRYHKEKTSLS